MYRRMGPKDLERLAEMNKQKLSAEDFEKAYQALKKANVPPPYKVIVAPDVDRP